MIHSYETGDRVIIVSGEQIHGFKVGSKHNIDSVSEYGQIFIRNEKGFTKWVNASEIELVEVNYSDELPEGEIAPRFFKCVAPIEDSKYKYYHTEGLIYVECSRDIQQHYDFEEGDDEDGDVCLYTDFHETVIIYPKEYMDKYFKEVL